MQHLEFTKLFYYVLLTSLASTKLSTSEEIVSEDYLDEVSFEGSILCRDCGRPVSDVQYLVEKTSPFALKSVNASAFGHKRVLVQLLLSPYPFRSPVDIVTFSTANCLDYGHWVLDDTWYPQHAWRPCICLCGAVLGWQFLSIEAVYVDQRYFTGLALSSIVDQTFADSLLVTPKVGAKAYTEL